MGYGHHMLDSRYGPPLPPPGYGSPGYSSAHACRSRTPPPVFHTVRPTIPHHHCYAHGYSSRDGYHSHSRRPQQSQRSRHHALGYIPGPYSSDRYGMPPMHGPRGYDPAYHPNVDPYFQPQYHDGWSTSPWKRCC